MSMATYRRWAVPLVVLLLSAAPLQAQDVIARKISAEPADIVLLDPDQSIDLVVTAEMSDGSLRDATLLAHYSLEKGAAEIAFIHKGRVTPSASGKGTLNIRFESAPGKGVV